MSTVDDTNFEQDWADAMAGNYTIEDLTPAPTPTMSAEDLAFEQDWADAMAGKETIQDVSSSVAPYVSPSTSGSFTSGINSFLSSLGINTSTTNGLAGLIGNNAGLLTGLAGLYALTGGNQPSSGSGGYGGSIPRYAATRARVPYATGAGGLGRQNFTPVWFTSAADAPAAQAAAHERAAQIAAAAPAAQPQPNPYAGKFATPWAPKGQNMAVGGLAGGTYLQGPTDGMADELHTSIDDTQPAKLSHGEFVIPADVVSHLGNGNSDAGAQQLYSMMDKVRQARTGTTKQGKEINPDKFMPGGLATAKYASGGAVAFADGGTTATTATPSAGVTGSTTSSTLSPWAGDYVTNMLGKGQALSEMPYQQYTGQLTAGPSDLQQQQFAGLSQVAQTGLAPTQFTNQFQAPAAYTPTTFQANTFDATQANKYMNPYLQSSLDPQLAELRRQAQIANVADASKLTQGGAYGGGRQAVLMGEQNRNLLDKTNALLSSGYNTAYDKAVAQFNADQARELEAQKATEASRQFGAGQGLSAAQYGAQYGQAALNAQEAANQASANFGLKTLQDLGTAGAQQREIEQQGLTAEKAAFEAERDTPYKMVQYQQGLLQGLPISTSTNTTNNTALGSLLNTTGGLAQLYSLLGNLGQSKTTTPATTTPTTTPSA